MRAWRSINDAAEKFWSITATMLTATLKLAKNGDFSFFIAKTKLFPESTDTLTMPMHCACLRMSVNE